MTRVPLTGDFDGRPVSTIVFALFLSAGRCALPRDNSGRFRLTAGKLLAGEHPYDAALRIPLELAGFRMQRVHFFGRGGDTLYAGVEGDRYRGQRPHAAIDLAVLSIEDAVEALCDVGAEEDASIVAEAAASRWAETDEQYYAGNRRLLERAYLRASTAEGGSGFGGDADSWRKAREHIVDGINGDGAFLDLGCANGLLMETIVDWAGERGYQIDPFGVDLGPELVNRARERLPHWRDRIFPGNAIDWMPPDGRRFRFVHVLLEVVPVHHQSELLRHALQGLVAPGGRLLVSQYGNSGEMPPLAETIRRLGFTVAGEAHPHDPAFTTRATTIWIGRDEPVPIHGKAIASPLGAIAGA